MAQYDLLVIGTGPAGQKAAVQAAKLGKTVGIIERKEVVGGVCTNTDGFLTLKHLPTSMVIVGGGVIGTEYASILATMGVPVILIDKRPRLLEFVDAQIIGALQQQMTDIGVTLYHEEEVVAIRKEADGQVTVSLRHRPPITTTTLMYAIGRIGATKDLNLEVIGITPDARGRVIVNDHFQTSVPHIYAAGDVIGFPALASTSMQQGRHAACHAFGHPDHTDTDLLPYGIYSIPEISMVGRNEEDLAKAGIPFAVGIAHYREIARGQLIGDDTGTVKLLFHRLTHALLGVHAIGEGATELIHIGQAVMAYRGKIDYFIDTVFNYPTLAECYKVAALDGINRLPRPWPQQTQDRET